MTIVIQDSDIELADQKLNVEDPDQLIFDEKSRNQISLSPFLITKLLLVVTGALLVAHVAAVDFGHRVVAKFSQSADFAMYQEMYYRAYEEFHLGKELNLPTYFSTFLLVLAAYLLRVIHRTGNIKSTHWSVLSFIFLFLAIDELFMIHEIAGGVLGVQAIALLENVPPFLEWAWMIPYSVLAVGTGLYFLKFTLKLPPKTKVLFLISGVLYVFAALGLEFCESHFDTVYGPDNMVNQVLFPMEEVLEMGAVILFVHALLDFLVRQSKSLQFTLEIKR